MVVVAFRILVSGIIGTNWVLELNGTWFGLGLEGFGTKGFGTGLDNNSVEMLGKPY